MKKLLLIVLGSVFLVSCGGDTYWNEKNKTDFKKGCESSLNKSVEQSGVNVMDQLGVSVESLCECQLEKTIKEYPTGPAEKSEMMQSVTKNSKECIAELRS